MTLMQMIGYVAVAYVVVMVFNVVAAIVCIGISEAIKAYKED